jgi:hypothetical protein
MAESMDLSELSNPAAVKFESVGDRVAGRIIDVSQQPQTDIETGEPLYFTSGKPRLQLVIVLEIDGESRSLYAKGGTYEVASGEGTSLQNAITEAAKAAGAKSLDAGATLEVVHTGLGKKTNPAFSAPRLFRARYSPPVASVPLDGLFSDD